MFSVPDSVVSHADHEDQHQWDAVAGDQNFGGGVDDRVAWEVGFSDRELLHGLVGTRASVAIEFHDDEILRENDYLRRYSHRYLDFASAMSCFVTRLTM